MTISRADLVDLEVDEDGLTATVYVSDAIAAAEGAKVVTRGASAPKPTKG